MAWLVKLKDGTEFLGKRGLKEIWNEGFFERCYTVIGSKTIPVKSLIAIPNTSMSYRIKK